MEKTIWEIIDAYADDWHNIEWLNIIDTARLPDEDILKILQEAKGRDIVVKDLEEWVFDGEEWEYSWEIDENFDFDKYLK